MLSSGGGSWTTSSPSSRRRSPPWTTSRSGWTARPGPAASPSISPSSASPLGPAARAVISSGMTWISTSTGNWTSSKCLRSGAYTLVIVVDRHFRVYWDKQVTRLGNKSGFWWNASFWLRRTAGRKRWPCRWTRSRKVWRSQVSVLRKVASRQTLSIRQGEGSLLYRIRTVIYWILQSWSPNLCSRLDQLDSSKSHKIRGTTFRLISFEVGTTCIQYTISRCNCGLKKWLSVVFFKFAKVEAIINEHSMK